MTFALMFWACAPKTDRITPAALNAGLMANSADYALVDVRLGSEFEHGHIEGAVHLPYPGTLWHTDRVSPQPGQTVVLICYTGHRSRFPMRAMRKQHPEVQVIDLEGGMRAWWAAGLPSTGEP